MKQFLLIGIFFSSFLAATFAIDADVSVATFKGNTQKYAEVYLYILGNSVHYQTVENKTVAAIETVILFKQGEKIVSADKFILNSPPLAPAAGDTSIRVLDFSDLKRYALDNGTYTLEVTMTDLNMKTPTKRTFTKTVVMNYDEESLQISDIQPISNFTKIAADNPYAKNGYFFETHPYSYYPQQEKLLKFYVELYNSQQALNDAFIIRYFIQEEGAEKPLQMRIKRLEAQAVHALILQLDITEIASGNYELILEARNRQNELVTSKKMAFQRNNPFLNNKISDYATASVENTFVNDLNAKQINYALRALAPRMENLETEIHNNVVKSEDEVIKRKYLYNYWLTKDPQTPHAAFLEYMKMAQEVDKEFRSSFNLGFETDRGYVYMKYGKPNDIIKELSDPTAPPYEIWQYYDLLKQQNVKFVFSNSSLAVNDYQLIHSTLRGEYNNPNWQKDLYKNSPVIDGNYQDATRTIDNMGRNANSRFDQ